MSVKRVCILFVVLCLSVFVAGCGSEKAERDSEAILQKAQALTPADAKLAEVYERSCVSCHAVADTSAPLTGDRESWAPRMAQGMDTLVDHVIEGYGGMPPLGLCMECEPDQFQALIEFMGQ